MIIQLLTHYTKSILKSLINQLSDISRRVKCGGAEGEIAVAHGRLPSPAYEKD